MSFNLKLPNPFEWKSYNYLVALPVLLVLFSAFFLVPNIPQGIDLKGGLLLTAYTNAPVDSAVIKAALADYPDAEVRAFTNALGSGFEVEIPVDARLQSAEASLAPLHDLEAELTRAEIALSYYQGDENATPGELAGAQANVTALTQSVFDAANSVLEASGAAPASGNAHAAVASADAAFDAAKSEYRQRLLAEVSAAADIESYSFKEIGASLSKVFFSKVQEVLVYSFILSTIVVFFIFRSIVPSLAVVFGAVADIVITAGLMGVLGIPLSLASIAALLMLIGFSLETDALLTVRVYKRTEGTVRERAFDAMKTGIMMNASVVTAFGVLALLAAYLQIPTYYQIGMVAVLGACVDFVATWCFNAPVILWDADKRGLK